jgi:hypothetical protein
MHMIRRSAVAIGLAATCAAALVAQSQETHTTTRTKIEIKDGKDVTVVGCLERGPNGDFILTEAHDNRRFEGARYALVTNKDLSKHVGERVRIKGKAVVDGEGKVEIESKTRTETDNSKDQETRTRTEATSGALVDPTVLGVSSMKTLSSTCN